MRSPYPDIKLKSIFHVLFTNHSRLSCGFYLVPRVEYIKLSFPEQSKSSSPPHLFQICTPCTSQPRFILLPLSPQRCTLFLILSRTHENVYPQCWFSNNNTRALCKNHVSKYIFNCNFKVIYFK